MGRKGAETDFNTVNVATFLAFAQAERELYAKADACALAGAPPLFSRQLWQVSGLVPKLFGKRRQAFLKQQENERVQKHETILMPNISREARALNRAARQRHSAMHPELPLSPKLWKAEIIAEYEKSQDSTDRSQGSQGSRSGVLSARADSNGRDLSRALVVSVKAQADRGEYRSQAENAKKELSPANRGNGHIAAVSSPRASARSRNAPEPSTSCCVHCQESLGGSGCGKPLLNCRDCGQVMHFDCYVEWSGSEPGPWDIILCPAHTPPKRVRTKPPSTAVASSNKDRAQGNTTPRKRSAPDRPPEKDEKDSEEHLTPLKQGAGPLSVTSPRASQKRRTSTDMKFHFHPGSSCDEPTAEQKGEVLQSRNPESPSSPALSYSSTDTTHHSPATHQDYPTLKLGQAMMSSQAGGPRPGEKLNDEELAMELHRQLNAPVSRRRRGD